MEIHKFRGILLKLQNSLSDEDRKRLHFFFGNEVPRRIRDDPSLSGTLNLLEFLFDQDKINENDFTLLIKAFNEIQCYDAANLLTSHIKEVNDNSRQESIERLSSIMPKAHDTLFQNQETHDKINIKHNFQRLELQPIVQTNSFGNKSVTINPPTTFVHNTQSKIPIASIVFCIVMFGWGIVTYLYISQTNRVQHLENELGMKVRTIHEEQLKYNETIRSNIQLKNQLIEYEENQNKYIIRPGKKYGGSGGITFDDSFMENFTLSHRLHGIIQYYGSYSTGFQFIYSSPFFSEYQESPVYGENKNTKSAKFLLYSDEIVNKVQIVYRDTAYIIGKTEKFIPIIKAIRLFTNKGRMSSNIDHVEGTKVTEYFDGYVVAYVTGKSGLAVDQIQFHWIRVKSG